MQGKGVMRWPNGTRFEGEWNNGERNPNGVFTLANGGYYSGHITDDFINSVT